MPKVSKPKNPPSSAVEIRRAPSSTARAPTSSSMARSTRNNTGVAASATRPGTEEPTNVTLSRTRSEPIRATSPTRPNTAGTATTELDTALTRVNQGADALQAHANVLSSLSSSWRDLKQAFYTTHAASQAQSQAPASRERLLARSWKNVAFHAWALAKVHHCEAVFSAMSKLSTIAEADSPSNGDAVADQNLEQPDASDEDLDEDPKSPDPDHGPSNSDNSDNSDNDSSEYDNGQSDHAAAKDMSMPRRLRSLARAWDTEAAVLDMVLGLHGIATSRPTIIRLSRLVKPRAGDHAPTVTLAAVLDALDAEHARVAQLGKAALRQATPKTLLRRVIEALGGKDTIIHGNRAPRRPTTKGRNPLSQIDNNAATKVKSKSASGKQNEQEHTHGIGQIQGDVELGRKTIAEPSTPRSNGGMSPGPRNAPTATPFPESPPFQAESSSHRAKTPPGLMQANSDGDDAEEDDAEEHDAADGWYDDDDESISAQLHNDAFVQRSLSPSSFPLAALPNLTLRKPKGKRSQPMSDTIPAQQAHFDAESASTAEPASADAALAAPKTMPQDEATNSEARSPKRPRLSHMSAPLNSNNNQLRPPAHQDVTMTEPRILEDTEQILMQPVQRHKPPVKMSSSLDELHSNLWRLDPGEWLNDSIVNTLISRFRSSAVGFVNSLTLETWAQVDHDEDQSGALQDRLTRLKASLCSGAPNAPIQPSAIVVLIPAFDAKRHHWVLYVFICKTGELQLYDPLAVDEATGLKGPLSKLVERFVQWLFDFEGPVATSQATAPQQTNSHDCGVYVIEFARLLSNAVNVDCSCCAKTDTTPTTLFCKHTLSWEAGREQVLRQTLLDSMFSGAMALDFPRLPSSAGHPTNSAALLREWVFRQQWYNNLIRVPDNGRLPPLLASAATQDLMRLRDREAAALSASFVEVGASRLHERHRAAIKVAIEADARARQLHAAASKQRALLVQFVQVRNELRHAGSLQDDSAAAFMRAEELPSPSPLASTLAAVEAAASAALSLFPGQRHGQAGRLPCVYAQDAQSAWALCIAYVISLRKMDAKERRIRDLPPHLHHNQASSE